MNDIPLTERIRAYLERGHLGAENGIRGRDLATELGVSGRKLRAAVEALRDAGVPIGAHPETGYYYPATAEEAEVTVVFLENRGANSIGQARKIREWARARFGPQLSLLGALLLVATGTVAPPLEPAAWAQTFAEVEWFDRARRDCDGFEDTEADCTYRYRLLLHLEEPPFEAAPWFRLLARIEVLSRRAEDETGHFNPVKSDLGGGVVVSHGPWSLTLLLSSQHCMDVACRGDTYNSLTLRWRPNRPNGGR